MGQVDLETPIVYRITKFSHFCLLCDFKNVLIYNCIFKKNGTCKPDKATGFAFAFKDDIVFCTANAFL